MRLEIYKKKKKNLIKHKNMSAIVVAVCHMTTPPPNRAPLKIMSAWRPCIQVLSWVF